jgi:ElaB/YqjD/DUF883 family membrane-anchored ribosome-binding protein
MEVANSMRDLSEHILKSYVVRTKELDDLVSNIRKTLVDFADKRKHIGQEQTQYLSDFTNSLSANVDEMLKGYHKSRKAMSEGQTKYLKGIANDLTKNTSDMLTRLLQDRGQMSDEQARHLGDFGASLAKNVRDMLKGFYKDHQQMSDEQARHLGDFVNNLTRDTNTMMNGFKKAHGEMSAELRTKLAANLANIRTYTGDKLKEFGKSHGRMSDSLKKSLTRYVNDLAKDVSGLLHNYDADMKKAAKSWDKMSSTLSGLRIRTTVPSVEVNEKASTVQEAIDREKPEEREAIPEAEVEGKVLQYINKHPEGIKVGNMEMALGLSRMKLGMKAKKLLKQGRVRKEANMYYPLEAV